MKWILFCLLSLIRCLSAEDIDIDVRVYRYISDLYHPTIEDLKAIQYAINYAPRPLIRRCWDREFVPREFKMIGDTPEEMPERGMFAVHSDIEERENCIVVYASFNKNYPNGLRRLVKKIIASDFKGHIHFQIGGWPNLNQGDLVLAHVPYAFKVSFLREIQRMGYKRALWLDASILPSQFTSVNQIFATIENQGYFVQGNDHTVGAFLNEETLKSFDLTQEEANAIPSCSSAILGIDLTSKRGAGILNAWYDAVRSHSAFYTPRPDQTSLSIILYRMGLMDWAPLSTLARIDTDNPDALFIMDRNFVKY